MTNTTNQPPEDEPAREASTPDPTSQPTPEPFDPQSEEEVAARFGERVAGQWLEASTHLRRAMIRQLLRLEADMKKREEEEAANAVIEVNDDLDDDADDARRAEQRGKTYVFTGGEKEKLLLEKNRDRYLGEITQKLALLQGQDVPHAGRLREDISRRCLHVHIIETMLNGPLTFDAVKALVAADARCADLSAVGVEYEYDEFLERLMVKRFVRVQPPASGS